MTQAQLTELYAEATGLPKKEAAEHLSRLGDIMACELLAGGDVTLPSLGKLKTVDRAARQGRNPRTGVKLDIPAKRAVVFTIGKDLKGSLN